jgi:NADPH-dependent glutamate synthase beta subunit-like oxidoreductase/ferredoxin
MIKTYKKAQPPVEISVKTGESSNANDLLTHEISVPCQKGCPVHTDIPGYIEAIYNKDFDTAYRINLENNVLPGVLGRICVRPCQSECRHNWSDIHGPVEICRLKRVAADNRSVILQPLSQYFTKSNFTIAVLGAGPAGIAAARELSRFGHTVTIYEKENHPGGMLIDGIPRFRLPIDIVNDEVKYALSNNIALRLNSYIDKSLFASFINNYDAVVVATGTVLPNHVDIKHLPESKVLYGLDFMKTYNSGKVQNLEGDVVIIGGGFTAVDTARACARTARKMIKGNGKITIVYRRPVRFMAADKEELESLEKENISILTLLSPIKASFKNGHIEGIHFQKNICSSSGSGIKPVIVPVESSDVFIPCNHVIIAAGQKQDFSIFPEDVVPTGTFTTSHNKVFLAGDIKNGSLDVIHAIADGKEVARHIDTMLSGKNRLPDKLFVEQGHSNGESGRSRHHDVQIPASVPSIPLGKRIDNNSEVEQCFTGDEIANQASRCYFCHYTFEIDQDKCIHCNWCIDVTPRKCISKVASFRYDKDDAILDTIPAEHDKDATFIWINNKNCIRCGKCFRVCPVSAITMRKTCRKNIYQQ